MRFVAACILIALVCLAAADCPASCGLNAVCGTTQAGGTECQCNPGYYKVAANNANGFACQQCMTQCGAHGVCYPLRNISGSVIGEACKCSPGWVSTDAAPCSACDTRNGFQMDNSGNCVPAPNCTGACNHGTCVSISATVGNTTVTVYACKCSAGWVNNPSGGSCNVCDTANGYVSSGNGCSLPTTCNPACPSDTQTCTSSNSGGNGTVYTCACKTGFTGFPNCVPSRCSPECIYGRCEPVVSNTTNSNNNSSATASVSYQCLCDYGYTGAGCNTAVAGQDPTTCGGACLARQQCVAVQFNSTTIGPYTRYQCLCKNYWQNQIINGVVSKCTLCPPAYTGNDCDQVVGVNSDLCSSVTCPDNSACAVATVGSTTAAACVCIFGYQWNNGVCQPNSQNTNPCASVSCPSGSICVSSANQARCICNTDGYIMINNTCVQKSTLKCDPACDANSEVCILQPASNNGSQIVYAPTCTCKPQWVPSNTSNECVCSPGWTGDQCNVPIDPCRATHCPDNTHCTLVSGSPSCTCNPNWGGVGCTINLCAGVVCHGGQCLAGTCVCPYSFTYNGTDCNRPVGKGCDPTAGGCDIDSTRNLTFTSNAAGVTAVSVFADGNYTDTIVASVGVAASGNAQLSWSRTQTNGVDTKVTTVALTINGVVEWRDVDGNGVFDPNNDIVNTVSETSYQSATVTDTLNNNGDTVHQLTLTSTDNILEITSYLAPRLVLVGNNVVPPKNNKFGITINYPVGNYKYPDSMLCLSLTITTTLNVTVSDPGTGYFVWSLKNAQNSTVHRLLWEDTAMVGGTETTVTLYVSGTTGSIPAYLCFSTPVPDVISYDPQSDYSTADQVSLSATGSVGSITVPSVVLVVLALLALFL